jgi:hypothetical protein
VLLFVIFLYNFNEVRENFSHYPMCGGKCNYYKRPNPLFVYPTDKDTNIPTDYQYTMIAKDTLVPPVISGCSFGACGEYRMCGVAQHLRNSSFRLILWEERMPSGGPVVYNYMLTNLGGGSGGQNSQKIQTDKELSNGDEIHIIGYPGKFRITLNHDDVPYPYTLQTNVI